MGMKPKSVTEAQNLPPVPPLPKIVKAVEQTKEKAGDDKVLSDRMTKQDWSNKDRAIERVAIIKSVLESPMLAQLVVGRNEKESFETLTKLFNHSVELFYGK